MLALGSEQLWLQLSDAFPEMEVLGQQLGPWVVAGQQPDPYLVVGHQGER